MCGIVGVIGESFAAKDVYKGLYALQHRGQDSIGFTSYDLEKNSFQTLKKLGLITQVREQDLAAIPGNACIGHTRYKTVGSMNINDVQPMMQHGLGTTAMAHNGNLINYQSLKKNLNQRPEGETFTDCDVELIHKIFHQQWVKQGRDIAALKTAVSDVHEAAKGGYSVVTICPEVGVVAFKDPKGIRPLMFGFKKDETGKTSWAVASESQALEFMGYELVRDLRPGEGILFTFKGEVISIHNGSDVYGVKRPCMFEWVYFSNANGQIEGQSVLRVRKELGKLLGEQIKDKLSFIPDVVGAVPETSRISALLMAETMGISFREILIKNRYINRSFIVNGQAEREKVVNFKLRPLKEEVEGKKILLVDDSIVRGTTAKQIVAALKEAGAKEIMIASTCPPIQHPCFYGVDFPFVEDLIAYNRTEEEIAEVLGVKQVTYLSIENLKKAISVGIPCTACLDGMYPLGQNHMEEFITHRKNEDSRNAIV